ncbi:penicillin-binding protein activator [Lichenihabitans sp. Uapishka_5]|uniref:penicillin-binding protein activator n=1 Tax=Lichenihabitans sp. Uapishka_5 TaxID=3037302 RepID=UPI0029E804E8|nr:penicillin-binding protein activator [Lichenihabitans sp. Uapishka_5]MDX7952394.1 penicillin-binding protein activator [Lichenihabitans sp. Uapishka_5]
MGVVRGLRAMGTAASIAALVAGCSQIGVGGATPPTSDTLSAPLAPVQSKPLASVAPTAIGSGPTKIALVLPLTQNGAPSGVGTALRNAAELAYAESGSTGLTILVKDDHGTPDGARDATQAALGEGAEMILGPLFAGDVREAARVAKAANRPVIGFSTDSGAASNGVYLLSFLIENYVDRIVDYAAQQGKKSFAALVPENDYGNVALAEFQAAAARRGVRVEAIERYAPGQAGPAIQRIAGDLPRIDALFIPEGADAMASVAQTLQANTIDSHKVQILGTGVWNDARVLKLPALQGAWFATPENTGFNAFAGRYRAKFGNDPARIATLSYDAVSLVAALARTQGANRFTDGTLTNASGFNGADGVFRFRPDGLNERGLAVLAINNGSATTVSPAPRTFSATASAQ